MGMIKTPPVRRVARCLARILGDMAQFCDAAAGGDGLDSVRSDWNTMAEVLRACVYAVEAKL